VRRGLGETFSLDGESRLAASSGPLGMSCAVAVVVERPACCAVFESSVLRSSGHGSYEVTAQLQLPC
jgi:hypothetical protein